MARSFGRAGRLDEALACLDAALAAPTTDRPSIAAREETIELEPSDDPAAIPWWHPNRAPDIGGRSRRPTWERIVTGRLDSPWTAERVTIERGRLLRRLGRHDEAVATWLDLAAGPGAIAVQAWVEVAKLREHRLGDVSGALDATSRAIAIAERRRRLGMGDPIVDRALVVRLERLRRRAGPRSDRKAGPAETQPAMRSTAIATEPPPPRQSVASP